MQSTKFIPALILWAAALLVCSNGLRADDSSQPLSTNDPLAPLELGIWGKEVGTWRTKAQLHIDPQTRELSRRSIKVWDPWPSKKYDFKWRSFRGPETSEDIANSAGELVWLRRDVPNYDSEAIVGTYRGEMQQGRPEGRGKYFGSDGLIYEGTWLKGEFQGQGRLSLANGDELQGTFVGGKPNGMGRYIDATGEIFHGWFVDGRREGTGTIRSANGASYDSVWRDGIEVHGARVTRVAQTGPVASTTSENLRLRIIVDQIAGLAFRGVHKDEVPKPLLGYSGSNVDNALQIRPDSRRLLQLWKGDAEIQLTPSEEYADARLDPELSYGVFSYAKSVAFPLRLTIELENRRSKSARLERSYIEVSQSKPEQQPAIQASIGVYNSCGLDNARDTLPYSPRVTFENFGWSPARNAVIRYKFANPNAKTQFSDYDHSQTLGNIDRFVVVSFEKDLATLNLRTSYFATEAKKKPEKRALKCQLKDDKLDLQFCISSLGGAKMFGSLIDKVGFPVPEDTEAGEITYAAENQMLSTDVIGTLEYDWTDQTGSHHRVSNFRNHLMLGAVNEAVECGEGASAETKRQEAIQLKHDEKNYRVPLPFKGFIRPGQKIPYKFGLNAMQSSQHDFVVVLEFEDGEIVKSRAVNFLSYTPSWYHRPRR